MTYPRAFSHIGLSVPNIEKAVKFYSDVMGWYLLMEPTQIDKDDTDIGIMCNDVFGDDWTSFKIAHFATSNGVGIEIFEFPNNEPTEKEFKYWKTGVFHYCVIDPNLEELVEKIVAHGGKQRMPVRHYYKGEKPYRMCYVEDPFGIVFEVYSHSYELTYSKGAY